MDLLDLHLLADLQKRCLLADYEQMDLLDPHLLADYEQMGLLDLHLLDLHLLDLHKICLLQLRGDRLLDLHLLDLHLQLQKKCLLSDYKHQDSMEYDHRFQEMNPANGSPIARGGAGARFWCGQ